MTTALASAPPAPTLMVSSGSSVPHTFMSIVTRSGRGAGAVVVTTPVIVPALRRGARPATSTRRQGAGQGDSHGHRMGWRPWLLNVACHRWRPGPTIHRRDPTAGGLSVGPSPPPSYAGQTVSGGDSLCDIVGVASRLADVAALIGPSVLRLAGGCPGGRHAVGQGDPRRRRCRWPAPPWWSRSCAARRAPSADGTYRFEGLAPGEYHVSVRAEGYSSRRTEVTVAAGGATLDLEVDLDLHFAEVLSVSPNPRPQFESFQPTSVLSNEDLGAAAAKTRLARRCSRSPACRCARSVRARRGR